MITYLVALSVSFIIVFLITPNIRYIALKFYVIDRVNHRKIHKKIVTKLGGIAIYLGFLGALFTVSIFEPGFLRTHFFPLAGIIICSGLMLILGIYDDFQGSSASIKLIIQAIIALLVIKAGFILKGIFIPGLLDIKFGIFAIPLTCFWVVGIINAVNLIDGLDGLAAGLGGIISFFICLYGILLRDNFSIFISLALAGANIAFLRYNFYPAKIFMGDTGSLFLGSVIAMLGIYRPHSGDLNNPYFVPVILVLFLPILDTFFAIIRRILKKQWVFRGDSSHIHHFYLKRGFNQVQTVIRFYVMTFILGVVSLLIVLMY